MPQQLRRNPQMLTLSGKNNLQEHRNPILMSFILGVLLVAASVGVDDLRWHPLMEVALGAMLLVLGGILLRGAYSLLRLLLVLFC
ncbi:hypothetical protein [Aliagarivorans taiwanensis]|uniref:hypothetical protein n=1 Tax=Aliagarivorans taiwanensis TaxID=561966 RepID=UPI0012FB34F8|nr:hypothetical protein [Aliagarivorans taiwanensis]